LPANKSPAGPIPQRGHSLFPVARPSFAPIKLASREQPRLALKKEPTKIDQAVGARIRLRRMELAVTQEKLAEQIGVTFQQVQKYEKAANRVGASRLYSIAAALGVDPAYFLTG
jgi:DNA-binding transcriptional regulator YiaG